MIVVHVNEGEFAGIPHRLLEHAVSLTLRDGGEEEGEISLTFLSDAEIRELNRHYLGHDCPTDVLTFRLHEDGEPVLGDVYIGFAQAAHQALERDIPIWEELVRLAIHGTLHVLGSDHPEGSEREDSPHFRRQEALVARVLADPPAAG